MDNIEEKYFLTRGKVILFALILIVIFIIIIIVKKSGNNSLNDYRLLENELKSAAENYLIIAGEDVENGRELRISMDTLKKYNLIFSDLKDKCTGYTVVSSEKDISKNEYQVYYRPYINCGSKYITPNYSEY